jgi:hypothetical protein
MYLNIKFEHQNCVWKRPDLGTSNHYSKLEKKKTLGLDFLRWNLEKKTFGDQNTR